MHLYSGNMIHPHVSGMTLTAVFEELFLLNVNIVYTLVLWELCKLFKFISS